MYEDYYDQDFQLEAQTKSPKGHKKKAQKQQNKNFKQDGKVSSLPKVHHKNSDLYAQQSDLNRTKKKEKESKLSRKGQSVDNLMHFSKDNEKSRVSSNKKITVPKIDSHSSNNSKQDRQHSKSTFTLNHRNIKLKAQGNLRKQLALGKKYERLALRTTLTTEVQKIEKYFNQNKSELNKMKDDQLNRLNNRIRQWIKKINIDIDSKIGEAIREKQTVTLKKQKSVDEILRLIESQMMNNEEIMKLQQSQLEKLHFKQQQIENQDDIELQRELIKKRQSIVRQKQNIKSIKNNSVRLSQKLKNQQTPAIFSKQIESTKQKILLQKAQQSKNIDVLNKLESQLSDLESRYKHQTQQYEKLLQQAKNQHIELAQNNLKQDLNYMKERINKVKSFNSNVENIANRNAQQIQHEIKLMRQEMRQYDRDYQLAQQKIQKNHEKALNLIQANESFIRSHYPNSNAVTFFTQKSIQNNNSIFMPNNSLLRQDSKKKYEVQKQSAKQQEIDKSNLGEIKQTQEQKSYSKNPSGSITHAQQEDNEFMNMNPPESSKRIWTKKDINQQQNREQANEPVKISQPEGKKQQETPQIFPKRFKRRIQPKQQNQSQVKIS